MPVTYVLDNISISPAAGVLNYGQGLFEGMKAYRTDKDRVVFFRPDESARRMQRGADRLKMPPVPESIFIDAVEQVVQANIDWLPPMGRGCSSTVVDGSGPVLGVSPAQVLVHDLRHTGWTLLQGRHACH